VDFQIRTPCGGRWLGSFFGSLLLFSLVLSSIGRAATNEIRVDEKTLQDVTQAAREATKIFFPRAENRKAVFGFDAADNLDSAVLKSPVNLYTLKDSEVATYHAGQPLASLLQPTGQWLVPVAIGGTNRAMISVIETADGKWTGSSFGMAPLSRKWQSIQAWWPAGKFTPQLIILPAAQGYFFTIPEEQPPNLTALGELPAALVDPKTTAKPPLRPAENLLSELRDTLTHSPNNEPENQTNESKTP